MRSIFTILILAITSISNAAPSAAPSAAPTLSDSLAMVHSFYDTDGLAFEDFLRANSSHIEKIDPQVSSETETNLNLSPLYRSFILQTCGEIREIASKEDLSASDRRQIGWRLVWIIENIAALQQINTEVLFKIDGAYRKAGASDTFWHDAIAYQNKERVVLMHVAALLKVYIQKEL